MEIEKSVSNGKAAHLKIFSISEEAKYTCKINIANI
jgi:hypothetical protein